MLCMQWNYCAFGDLLHICNNWDGVISYNSAAKVLVSTYSYKMHANLERLVVS